MDTHTHRGICNKPFLVFHALYYVLDTLTLMKNYVQICCSSCIMSKRLVRCEHFTRNRRQPFLKYYDQGFGGDR